MVSLAEKMAANMDMSAFSKADELKRRLWFTILALIVFRLGTFIPLPGIDAAVLSDVFAQHSGGILGMFNMFSGGALSRMTIFALNIFPYISASIIIQLGQSVIPSLAALKKEGEAGHRKVTHYTKILTVLITIIQGYGINQTLIVRIVDRFERIFSVFNKLRPAHICREDIFARKFNVQPLDPACCIRSRN